LLRAGEQHISFKLPKTVVSNKVYICNITFGDQAFRSLVLCH
jgi:hypothetical protein